jgi:hypothetical protein
MKTGDEYIEGLAREFLDDKRTATYLEHLMISADTWMRSVLGGALLAAYSAGVKRGLEDAGRCPKCWPNDCGCRRGAEEL